MITKRLLIGTVDDSGRVDARPVIVETDETGCVTAWHYLCGHEPAATVDERALLALPSETIIPL